MKKIMTILILLLFPSIVNAAIFDDTIFTYGGDGRDGFTDVKATPDGGYVAVGYTSSSDIEGIVTNGTNVGLIVKFDKNNQVEWQQKYDTLKTEQLYGVSVTQNGDIYAVGDTNLSSSEVNPNYGNRQGIVIKFDKDGNILWEDEYGNGDNGIDYLFHEFFYKVTATTDGGCVVVGTSFAEGLTNTIPQDLIMVKYDKNGNIEWQQNITGVLNDAYLSVVELIDGTYVASGVVSEIDSEGEKNMNSFIVKYDKDGTLLWLKKYDINSKVIGGVNSTSDGGFIAVGDDYTSAENNNVDALIEKYDKDGNIEWQQTYGSGYFDYFYSVVPTSDGGYIAVGVYDREVYTNPSLAIVKYDNKGNLEWQKTYDGVNGDTFLEGCDILVDGTVITIGFTESPTLANTPINGDWDALVISLSASPEIKKEETKNGTFEAIQEGGKGKITIKPSEGYELDKIVITDYKGTELAYKKENGYYYFDMNSDVTVNVTYKKIVENPNTSVGKITLAITILLTSLVLLKMSVRKKEYQI